MAEFASRMKKESRLRRLYRRVGRAATTNTTFVRGILSAPSAKSAIDYCITWRIHTRCCAVKNIKKTIIINNVLFIFGPTRVFQFGVVRLIDYHENPINCNVESIENRPTDRPTVIIKRNPNIEITFVDFIAQCVFLLSDRVLKLRKLNRKSFKKKLVSINTQPACHVELYKSIS